MKLFVYVRGFRTAHTRPMWINSGECVWERGESWLPLPLVWWYPSPELTHGFYLMRVARGNS